MLWTYCRRCKRLTPHAKGKLTIKERKHGEKVTLEHFIKFQTYYCSVCGYRGRKLKKRFKTKSKYTTK